MDYAVRGGAVGDRPVLVFADTRQAGDAATQAAVSAGARPIAAGRTQSLADRLRAQASVAAVMVEVGADSPAELEAQLAALGVDAARRGYPIVITVPHGLIDMAAEVLDGAEVYLLCQPDPLQREVAIGLALAVPQAGVRDGDPQLASHRLAALSEEAGRIARALAALSQSLPPPMPEPREPGVIAVTPALIRGILRARRARERFLPADLFADPAWDMMLDLLAARMERQQVSVSSLCIAAAVPPTTALRWIKALTEQGLFVRGADRFDGRRALIALSDEAAEALSCYLSAYGTQVI